MRAAQRGRRRLHMAKKEPKKGTAKEAPKANAKADTEKELSEDQLEHVAGGRRRHLPQLRPHQGWSHGHATQGHRGRSKFSSPSRHSSRVDGGPTRPGSGRHSAAAVRALDGRPAPGADPGGAERNLRSLRDAASPRRRAARERVFLFAVRPSAAPTCRSSRTSSSAAFCPIRDPAAAAGRATIEARIAKGVGVTPLGLLERRSTRCSTEASPASFGQAKSMRCPHFLEEEGGRCGVWRQPRIDLRHLVLQVRPRLDRQDSSGSACTTRSPRPKTS